jgi:hypothetical protein
LVLPLFALVLVIVVLAIVLPAIVVPLFCVSGSVALINVHVTIVPHCHYELLLTPLPCHRCVAC